MKYSKTGLQLTEAFEGCKLFAYRDSKGVPTIGYGHTADVQIGDRCTQAEAEAWLLEDVAWAVQQVNQLVHVTLTQPEFDALVDFTFNCGAGNFDHSTLLRLVNHSDIEHAAAEFEKWDKAGGTVVAGLLRRRKVEAERFLEKGT